MILEQKIGFDRIRRGIAERCSTQYAVDKVWDEEISRDAKEIDLRLQLTDEMRLISMFEDSFPSMGFIDTKPFLLPLNVPSTYIDLVSLSKLRISLDTDVYKRQAAYRSGNAGRIVLLHESYGGHAYPEI